MKDCRNEYTYTLDLIQQMYNILVLSMSSRTLSTLLWPFLALSVQVHDKFSHLKVQGSRLFVTYTIIQGIISSEMEVRTGPLNGQCKKIKIKDDT